MLEDLGLSSAARSSKLDGVVVQNDVMSRVRPIRESSDSEWFVLILDRLNSPSSNL